MSIPVVIHAHLYQPPREDPWFEEIEGEESAHPFQDWNERITAECYRPMSASRVLDPRGRVERIVNTYEHVSFNVGPTLAAWLERRAPEVLEAMRAADEASRRRLGHGNAIAQVYNHPILPLCDRRDKETQVRWGIADFRRRFGRDPEAIWLAETAIDAETAEVLAAHGMRYVILAPGQAEAVRPEGRDWIDVSGGRVDTRWPYRLATPAGDLAAFFYHGDLAAAVSFQHLLRDGDELARRLREAGGGEEDALVHYATDGEVYGHHEPMGDMCLAHLATRAAPVAGLELLNYAAVLDRRPPRIEVRLAPGPDGEGTAWSCAHGVGRWIRDCGCRTGGPARSSQAWRGPLRAALDTLRDSLRDVFVREGGRVLRDPWAARDAYVEIVLARHADEAKRRFLAAHLKDPADAAAGATALRLLESQRHALLMYTSCAWFFWDVSGIETVQVMKYAHRAIDVLGDLAPPNVERRLLDGLERAKSNLAEHGDGAACYRRRVVPLAEAPARAAFQYAARRARGAEVESVYTYRIEAEAWRTWAADGEIAAAGVVAARHRAAGEETRHLVLLRRAGPLTERGAVAPVVSEASAPPPGIDRLAGRPWAEALAEVRALPGARPAGLATWFRPERLAAAREAFESVRPLLDRDLDRTLEDILPLLEACAEAGIHAPEAFEAVAARALAERALAAVREAAAAALARSEGAAAPADDRPWALVRAAIEKARALDLDPDLRAAHDVLAEALDRMTRRMEAEGLEEGNVVEAHDLIVAAHRAGLRPDLTRAQEALYRLLGGPIERAVAAAVAGDDSARPIAEAAVELAAFANLAVDSQRARLEGRPAAASAPAGGRS